MSEQWKPIREIDNYFAVSSYGRVKRIKASKSKHNTRSYVGQIIKLRTCNEYKIFTFSMEGFRKPFLVHGLVAKYFVGLRPKGKQVNHKDLDKGNNYYKNLEYLTQVENTRHAIRHGHYSPPPIKFGEDNNSAKLTNHQVRKIRRLYKTGKYTQKRLGRKYGVASSTIGQITSGRKWRSV